MRQPMISHDALFKMTIAAFLGDFFTLFFPKLIVKNYRLIDKEFFARTGAVKKNIEADLLLLAEVVVEGRTWQMLVLLEFKSDHRAALAQLREYVLHAALFKPYPVWPLIIYTDGGTWRKPLPDRFPLAFHSVDGINEVRCDIIRLKDHSSASLMAQHTMLGKLLAFRGRDTDQDRAALFAEVATSALAREQTLTNNQRIAMTQFLDAYSGVPPEVQEQIYKELGMKYMGSSFTEYYTFLGEERGEKRGEKRGELNGALQTLRQLREDGVIDQSVYLQRAAPLQAKLEVLQSKPTAALKAKRKAPAKPT